MMLDSNSVWLVTGCSSGIGEAIAKHVYGQGHRIVATARNTSKLSYLPEEERVLKLQLDVASPESVDAALKATLDQFGRIDVIINNAGYGLTGDSEAIPEAEARKQFDTNFWGAVRLTQAGVGIFRDVNKPTPGGTIIQISSIGGYLAFPGTCFYHASKFALEGFTKSIAKEMNPDWNIRFLIVSPGGVKTELVDNMQLVSRHPTYENDPKSPLNALLTYMSDPKLRESWSEPSACAAAIFSAVTGDKPLPVRLNLGPDTVDLMKNEIKSYQKDMEEWDSVTIGVGSEKYDSNFSLEELRQNVQNNGTK